MIQSLLSAGADVNGRTEAGKTPLDFAIEADRTEAVDLLEQAIGKNGKGR